MELLVKILWADVAKENDLPEGISCLVTGDYEVGEYLTTDERIPLYPQQAQQEWEELLAQLCCKRFGKSLLELGGNNAIIVTPNADLKITVIGLYLVPLELVDKDVQQQGGLIIHESIYEEVKNKLILSLQTIKNR